LESALILPGNVMRSKILTDSSVNLNETVETITQSLLEQVRAMDDGAWERLVKIYSPLVYKWCRESKIEPNVAADISQEVFIAVTRNISGFRHDLETSTFRGWLRTITRNKTLDYWSKDKKEPPVVDGLPIDQLSDDVEDESDSERITEESNVLFGRLVDFIRGQFSEKIGEPFGESRSTVFAQPMSPKNWRFRAIKFTWPSRVSSVASRVSFLWTEP
jgi:RNA polymerase sigma-70 factor (ECF subfamily)